MVTTRRGTDTRQALPYSLRVQQRMANARRTWVKRYRPADWTKRHRIDDDQPKTTRVISYTRRT